MDALALLCTLHADGPSSLKRLRSRGCGDLSALLSRTPDTVAEDLSIERPAARRLIREARLLADRVGITALEVEEAPPSAAPAPPTRALVPEAPGPTAPEGGLDSVDRALVERITRPAPTRPEVPGAEPDVEGPVEGPNEEPTPGEGAATEPRDEVAASLPGWMEGPAVSRADDPFSIPDEDFSAPEVPEAPESPEAVAPEAVAPEAEATDADLPAVDHHEVEAEAATPSYPEAQLAPDPIPAETPAEPDAVSLAIPAAGEVAAAIERALPEPTAGEEIATPMQPVAPLAFGAAVFGVGIEDHEEPVEVDLSVEPSAAEPSAAEPAPAGSAQDVAWEEPVAPAEQAPEPDPVSQPAAEAEALPTPESAPIPSIAEAVAAASSAALPGMDDALVEDLERLGIHSFAELSRAESLALTRGLGVTFAQARRLRFLARRAEADGTAWPQAAAPAVEPAAAPAAEAPAPAPEAIEAPAAPAPETPVFGAEVHAEDPTVVPVPMAEELPAEETPAEEPLAEEPLAEETAERTPLPFAAAIGFEPQADTQPESEPHHPSATPTEPAETPAAALDEGPAPEEREEEAAAEPAVALEPQGVRVDPSEVKARPRFGDQFARAAQQRRTSSEPGRTVLGWNFEIPRPEPEALPLASLLATPPGDAGAAEAVSGAPADPEGDAAGPFADA
ncbi:MAG: hypothetical protein ISQ11_05830 [Planctomycetes bacterium]|nr:hypothetical protein [Planctomycetota bacterium]